MQIVVIGGGYAGMAALIELRARMPLASLHLVDPGSHHLKVTQLHQALDQPIDTIRVPFDTLAERYDFTHHRAEAGRKGVFEPESLASWQADGWLPLGKERLDFDALVVATGAHAVTLPGGPDTFALADFRNGAGPGLVDRLAGADVGRPVSVSVVGGGATGIQFLFALGEVFKARRVDATLRLVNLDEQMLSPMPAEFHRYVRMRMDQAGHDYLGRTAYLGQEDGNIRLRTEPGAGELTLPSDATLLFPGVEPWPAPLEGNRFGQAVVDGITLADVYIAGDCSRLDGPGLNAMTAQAAVRKGKHVADNIARGARGSAQLGYRFSELGYVVSLGSLDAVGWMLVRANVLKGLAAFAVKEVIERQYDLFVNGIDTYLV